MKIVIVGARDRDSDADKEAVGALIERAYDKYIDCVIITAFASNGIGQFVKEKCLEKDGGGNFKFQMIECLVRTYTRNLTRVEYGEVCVAMNALLFELGDCFFMFAADDRRGTLEELITERVQPSGRPYRVFLPGDPVQLI